MPASIETGLCLRISATLRLCASDIEPDASPRPEPISLRASAPPRLRAIWERLLAHREEALAARQDQREPHLVAIGGEEHQALDLLEPELSGRQRDEAIARLA